MLVQLQNGDWVQPSYVGAVIVNEDNQAEVISHDGESLVCEDFDDSKQASKWRDDAARIINAAMVEPSPELKPS